MEEFVKVFIFSIYMVILSIEDVRRLHINTVGLITGAIGVFIFGTAELLYTNTDINIALIVSLLAAASPGLFLIATAVLTEKCGYADGIILVYIGLLFGFVFSVSVFGIALLLSALTGILLMALKKGNKSTKLPFIPYLLIGFMFVRFIS